MDAGKSRGEAVYSFRALARTDLPMIARWLRTPEARAWWGDPETEYGLLSEDLDEPAMRQWTVACDGRDFAYVQAYDPERWPQPHLMHLPPGSLVIDTFIGEPEMLGVGHGGRYLRAFARKLIEEGASAVAIDPAAENQRARRAYARAGFAGEAMVDTDSGPAVVMQFQRESVGAPRAARSLRS
uniref:GNAT family N-acetyltransferase n=2 Tax=Paracidobacterium acidisoli TaxID=2303751 RepID=A0A372IQK1_9BACT